MINFPDVTVREAYCFFDESESFDPVMIKNCKWQQNHAILNEDFLVHMRSGYGSEHDIAGANGPVQRWPRRVVASEVPDQRHPLFSQAQPLN